MVALLVAHAFLAGVVWWLLFKVRELQALMDQFSDYAVKVEARHRVLVTHLDGMLAAVNRLRSGE